MIATTRIFESEDEMFAWLIEKGIDVVDCCGETVFIEISGNQFVMNFKRLEDGRVELL